MLGPEDEMGSQNDEEEFWEIAQEEGLMYDVYCDIY